MASPACTVKDGAGTATVTTNGNNVTPGNTVTIQLISQAGVSSWSISCVNTDELSSAATVTASLTIDNINKLATFTAPVAGRAYMFQSQINGGLNLATQAVDPTATYTFCIYTLTSGAVRVIAANETTQGNPTAGWIATLNALIRNPTGGSFTPPTGTGFVTVTGGILDAASSATSATLYTKVTDPTGSGGRLVFSSSPSISTPSFVSGSFSYVWAVSAITASRTITLPLLTANDQLTFDAFATTLTNKTLVAANNTITDTSAATGDILRFNGTRFARLARGSANQVLQTNAGATDIAWATISASPGGSSGAMQFNNSSAFGGADMSYVSGTGYTIATNNTFIYGTDTGATARKLVGIDNSNYINFGPGYIQILSGGDDCIIGTALGQIFRGGNSTPVGVTDGLTGLTAGVFEANLNLNATYSNSTTSATATNLSFTATASEVWDIVVEGLITTTTSGIKFQLNTPAGAAVTGYFIGATTSAAAFTNGAFTSVNALSTALGTTAGTYYFRVSLTLTMGGTGGTVAFAAAGAAATLNQILAGTKMTIKRTVKV